MARNLQPSGESSKDYGSSSEDCPLKHPKGKITVGVMDARKDGVNGVALELRDKDGAIHNGTTSGGFFEFPDLPVGPCTVKVLFDDKEKELYHEPFNETGAAETAGGSMTIKLRDLIKTITPRIQLDKPRLLVDPVKKSSEPVLLTLELKDDAPQVKFKCDGKLVRAGGIEVYTTSACTSALTFAGDEASIPGADLAAPKQYWIKGTAIGRATLTLHGDPKETKPNVKVADDEVDGIDLFTPDATPKVTSVPDSLVPGGTRQMTISYAITDAERVGKEAVVEVVDKNDAVVKELKKLTLPGDNTGAMSVLWDGKGSSGSPDYDKNPYKVRLTVTDIFTRKTKDEAPTRLIKPGSIIAAMVHSDKSTAAGKGGVALSGVTLKVVGTSSEGPSAGDGTLEHKDLEPKPYTVEATLSSALAADFELLTPRGAVTVLEGAAARCEIKVDPLATMKVKLKSGATHISGAKINLTGTKVDSKDTGSDGVADFGVMPVGPYKINVAYVADSDNDKKYMVPAETSLQLDRSDQAKPEIDAVLMPALKVTVHCVALTPNKLLDQAEVKITTKAGKVLSEKTAATGELTFPHVPVEELKIDVAYTGDNAKNYEVPAQALFTPVVGVAGDKKIEVELKKCPVRVKLMMKLPDDTEHLLPKDLVVKLRLDDDKLIEGKLDDKGVIVDDKGALLKAPRIQKFTVEIPKTANKYFVIEKAGVTPATQEIIEDPDPKIGSTLGLLITAGKRAMLLPQEDIVLKQLDADIAPADNYAKPNFDFKDKEEIGTDPAPVKLLVKPKWQYVRFEYFDRRHGKADHGGKRISIPPVLLKAARKTTAGAIGAVEIASSFTIEDADNDKACQALPWLIVNKKADGTAMDKLDKDLHLEFGQADAWVEATSKTERKIIKLDAVTDKAKIAAHKDRDKLYDLPALWKSSFYYTRLTSTTGKFFDELTDTEIEGSYTKTKPLTFSLDDIVLTNAAGVQLVKDKNATNGAIDRSKYSRVAILQMDPDETYELKVWKPRTNEIYHTDVLFTKEAAADVYRNYLIEYPINPRAIVFCDGIHDLWNKRTATGTYAEKAVIGARAARLDDGDVTVKNQFSAASDVSNGYSHRERGGYWFYYLHGCATDGTTVYSAAVSHMTVRCFSLATEGVGLFDDAMTEDAADARNYRTLGMKNAMARWNEKKYQLEQEDKGKDHVIKTMALFQALDVEDPPLTIKKVGGLQMAVLGVIPDTGRSSASDTWMSMRKSAFRDEGPGPRGTVAVGPGTADYGGGDHHSNALAHEFGHAVIGLWDDYITTSQYGQPSFSAIQRFPGVPMNRDVGSMMSSNMNARVRSFWGRTRWINAQSQGTLKLSKFLAGKKFVATYQPPGKDKLFYKLPDTQVSFWTPFKTEELDNSKLGEQGKVALHLYAMGSDEFSNMIPDGPYDGMVVLDTRVAVNYENGMEPAPKDWKDAVAYVKGNVADFEADFYVCKENHTSSAEFATDAAKWQKIDVSAEAAWTKDQDVTAGKLRTSGGNSYVVLTNHKSGAFIDTFWMRQGASKGAWVANGTVYSPGDLVTEGGGTKICKTGGPSGAAFDGGNWAQVGADKGAHTANVSYAVGEVVTQGGGKWVCQTAHKGASVDGDAQANRIVKSDSKLFAWPPQPSTTAIEAKRYEWLGAFRKGITQAMEGTDDKGKFRFTRDGDSFSKIYVRPFPQFTDKSAGTPEAGGTPHFTVSVRRADSKGFGPSGTTMNMSKNVDFNTFVRYIYGRLSDDRATRKTQTPTDAIAIADLAKIKEWVDTAVAGTATAAEALPETPRVNSLAPAGGAPVGDAVTITGERFTGATKVTFNGIEQATLTAVTATSLSAAVPAGATTGRVKVYTPKGSGTSPASYKVLPKITALAPTTAVAEEAEITITGTTLTNPTEVKVNGKVATFTPVSATEVKAKIPKGATTGTVQVTTADGTATSATSITIIPPPKVDSFAPTSAKVADVVTITGTNLDQATEVKIGGVVATIDSKTATEIKAKVGVGAASGTVLVTTPGGAASAPGYTLAT